MVVPLVPVDVQMVVVVLENVTGRPELAVPDTVNGDWISVRAAGAANAMVWSARVTWKLCVTWGAAA